MQLDTISVLARSHELVAYVRLGPVQRAQIEAAYWSDPATAFEYYAHANCVIPIEDWPWFHFRRGQLVEGPAAAHEFARLRRSEGRAARWAHHDDRCRRRAQDRRLVELVRGEAGAGADVCAWRVVARCGATGSGCMTCRSVVPAELLARQPSVEESYLHLTRQAARALGVGTARDIANYYMLLTSYIG